MNVRYQCALVSSGIFSIVLSACNSDSSVANNDVDSFTDTTTIVRSLDPTLFVSGALVEDPVIVDCELSDGTETTCYEITAVGVPADAAVGPFCPSTITTGSDESGIWLDGSGMVYEANGDFIVDLPNIYGDTNWQLYDAVTGEVNVTDTQEACEAAARPDVDAAYQNYCVECSLDYVSGGVSQTYLIPTTPIPADAPGSPSLEVGVTLNGVQLAAPAPVDAILSNYTIAAFDDCGGEADEIRGYHYHASAAVLNKIIGCFMGEQGAVADANSS